MTRRKSAGLLAALCCLTTCAATPAPVEVGEKRWYPLTVSFGADANTLLMGTCPTGAKDKRDCRVEMLDLATNRSVAFTAPPGRFLQMPSFAVDGKSILAVATDVAFDATGNRPAMIVRFDPQAPDRAQVVVESQTELLMPSETKWGLAAWTERCQTATQKYCHKNPIVRFQGQAAPTLLSHTYDFIRVGPIFVRDGEVMAEAHYPPSFDLSAPSIIYVENRNDIWHLTAAGKNGSERVPQVGLAGLTLAANSQDRLYMIAEDREGLGIFRQDNLVSKLVAPYPKEAKLEQILSLTAVAGGRRFAAVARCPREVADETRLLVADHLFTWKQKVVPKPALIRKIALISRED